jgi:hypothetical protein
MAVADGEAENVGGGGHEGDGYGEDVGGDDRQRGQGRSRR